MNYIEQIRGFWRSHEINSFSTTEIAVYFYLLEVCNFCGWKNPFKRNNVRIEADLGISFNTLKNARNKLQQYGLIAFTTKKGTTNVVYTLSKFDKVSAEADTDVGAELTAEADAKLLPTKYKLNLNETKQESGQSSVIQNFSGDNDEEKHEEQPYAKRKSFVKPTLQEVEAYCTERGNGVSAKKFVSYYESNGWRVGRNPMKDWQAAIRAWEQNGINDSKAKFDARSACSLNVDITKF